MKDFFVYLKELLTARYFYIPWLVLTLILFSLTYDGKRGILYATFVCPVVAAMGWSFIAMAIHNEKLLRLRELLDKIKREKRIRDISGK